MHLYAGSRAGRVILTRPPARTPPQRRVHLSADRVSINTFQMSAVKQRWVIMAAIFSGRASGRAGPGRSCFSRPFTELRISEQVPGHHSGRRWCREAQSVCSKGLSERLLSQRNRCPPHPETLSVLFFFHYPKRG